MVYLSRLAFIVYRKSKNTTHIDKRITHVNWLLQRLYYILGFVFILKCFLMPTYHFIILMTKCKLKKNEAKELQNVVLLNDIYMLSLLYCLEKNLHILNGPEPKIRLSTQAPSLRSNNNFWSQTCFFSNPTFQIVIFLHWFLYITF